MKKPIVHRISFTTSTQDEARRLIEAGRAGAGHVVVAETQTGGRGRFGREWISPAGGLYATFIRESSPIPSIRAGVAVVDALKEFGLDARLKWPNDVLVGEKKLAGILVEAVGDLHLVGIGVNLTAAPIPTATSASDHNSTIDRNTLVEALRERLGADVLMSETMTAYRSACATIGRRVRVAFADAQPSIDGIARDVDSGGRLVVETKGGLRRVASGDCFHLERCDAEPADRG